MQIKPGWEVILEMTCFTIHSLTDDVTYLVSVSTTETILMKPVRCCMVQVHTQYNKQLKNAAVA